MLFCLSLCDETKRVILDQDYYGEVLAMIEGRDWQEAREAAIRNPVMDAFTHRAGWGWMRREGEWHNDHKDLVEPLDAERCTATPTGTAMSMCT